MKRIFAVFGLLLAAKFMCSAQINLCFPSCPGSGGSVATMDGQAVGGGNGIGSVSPDGKYVEGPSLLNGSGHQWAPIDSATATGDGDGTGGGGDGGKKTSSGPQIGPSSTQYVTIDVGHMDSMDFYGPLLGMKMPDGEYVWRNGHAPTWVTNNWNKFRTGQVGSSLAGFGGNASARPCPVCHPSNFDAAAGVAQFAFEQVAITGFSFGIGEIFGAIGSAALPDLQSLGHITPPLHPFYNVVGTTAVFEASEVGEYGRTMSSPRFPLRFDGKTMGVSDYYEGIDESGMWRVSNHAGPMGTSDWTMPGLGTDVGNGFMVFDKPVTGWVDYNNMVFPDGSTPFNHKPWFWGR